MVVPLLALAPGRRPRCPRRPATTRSRFGIEVARKGLWNEARFRFERAVDARPRERGGAATTSRVALEQQGEFAKAREAYEKALKLTPAASTSSRTTICSGKPMTSEIARRRRRRSARRSSCPSPCWPRAAARPSSRSRSRRRCRARSTSRSFRRVLVAGFVTDLERGATSSSAPRRRACSRTSSARTRSCRCWSPTGRPCTTRWRACWRSSGRAGSYSKAEKDQFTAGDRPHPAGRGVLAQGRRGVPEPAHRHRARGLRGRRTARASSPRSAWCATPAPTARAWCAATATSSARASASPRTSTSWTAAPARPCTRRSSPRRSSTARSRRSRRSPPTSSSWTACCPNFLGVISPQKIRGTRVLLR